MKICLIAEGSYPYVTGGVSSWIQMLISNIPEHEFIILAINANENIDKTYKYKIPNNVIHIEDIYIETSEKGKQIGKRNVKIKEKETFKKFLAGEDFEWENMFKSINDLKDINISDILLSEDFFEIVSDIASKYYKHVVFNRLFWTIRSMMITMLTVLKSEIPKADIYHSVSTGYAGVMGAIGKYKNHESKLILTEHGIYTREREEEIIKADWVEGYFKENWTKYFYNLSKAAYQYSDEVLTLFKVNKELQVELGCNEDKINIIPNGVNIDKFKNLSKEKQYDTLNVGVIARVVPIKDIKTIIQAFNKANESIADMKLYIIGPLDEDEEYTHECYDLVASLENENIIFTGRVDVTKYIGNMDIIMLGSISEAQPLSLLEAMACKKPVIATNVGSCRELVYGDNDNLGKCGIIVPVMDSNDMAYAIIKLGKNINLREIMGEVGFKRVTRYYEESKFIDGYKNLYMSLEDKSWQV